MYHRAAVARACIKSASKRVTFPTELLAGRRGAADCSQYREIARAIEPPSNVGGAMMGSAMMPRRFPPPWSVAEQAARFVVRDHSGQFYRCGLRFVYLRRLFANIRRLAERSGWVSVLNSQTPRFSRCVFHRACACLISAKKRQLNQRIVSLLHCPSLRATLAEQSRRPCENRRLCLCPR
jgi:hypothetical protein